MLLLVGLGNPGNNYIKTRHNVGFMVLNYLLSTFNFTDFSQKFKSLYTSGNINNEKISLLKPQTFMNLSGDAVVSCCNFLKIKNEDIIIFYDDIDLEFGKVKYKFNSGHGGHNGIRDIQNKIGNNFHKIKIGIGRPENKNISISDYVLSNFSNNEMDFLENNLFPKIINSINNLITKDFNSFIQQLN